MAKSSKRTKAERARRAAATALVKAGKPSRYAAKRLEQYGPAEAEPTAPPQS